MCADGYSCYSMNGFLAPVLVPAALLTGVLLWRWLRSRLRLRRKRQHDQGYRLIHELKAYAAWLESLPQEPVLDAEDLSSGDTLVNARMIVDESFPALSQPLMRLRQADSELVRHLWQREVVRLSQPAALEPLPRDRSYRQLRDAQQELIEEIIARCQVLIGERGRAWRSTDMDSDFSASFS